MKKYLYLPLLLFCSCSEPAHTGKSLFDYTSFANRKTLEGTLLPTGELSMPTDLYYADGKLLLVNDMTPRIMQVYDLEKHMFTGEFLFRGKSKNEVLLVNNLTVDPAKGMLMVNDISSRKLLLYDLSDLDRPENLLPARVIETAGGYDNAFLRKDGMILYTFENYEDHDRIRLADTLGTVHASFAPYAQVNDKPVDCGYAVFTPQFVVNEALGRIAFSSNSTDVLDIYSMDGSLAVSLSGPDHFDAEYQIHTNGPYTSVAPTKRGRCAYFKLKARGDLIWALYSGDLYDEFDCCKYIMSFDWEGRPVDCFTYEGVLMGFDVDPESRTIYGLQPTPEGETRILVYEY